MKQISDFPIFCVKKDCLNSMKIYPPIIPLQKPELKNMMNSDNNTTYAYELL